MPQDKTMPLDNGENKPTGGFHEIRIEGDTEEPSHVVVRFVMNDSVSRDKLAEYLMTQLKQGEKNGNVHISISGVIVPRTTQ